MLVLDKLHHLPYLDVFCMYILYTAGLAEIQNRQRQHGLEKTFVRNVGKSFVNESNGESHAIQLPRAFALWSVRIGKGGGRRWGRAQCV